MNEKLGASIPFTNDGSGNLVKPRPPEQFRRKRERTDHPAARVRWAQPHFLLPSFEQFRQVETRSGLLQAMPTDRMRNGDFGEALTGRQLGVDPLGQPIMENVSDPRTNRVVNGQVVRDPFQQRDSARAPRSGGPEDQDNIPRRRLDDQQLGSVVSADTIKSISAIKIRPQLHRQQQAVRLLFPVLGPHYNGSDGLPIPITKCGISRPPPTLRVTNWVLSPTTLVNSRVGYVRHWNGRIARGA